MSSIIYGTEQGSDIQCNAKSYCLQQTAGMISDLQGEAAYCEIMPTSNVLKTGQ